jgi:hypothetical protein
MSVVKRGGGIFVVFPPMCAHFLTIKPNVLVKWLTFLLRILEVPGSNLGPQTGYRD